MVDKKSYREMLEQIAEIAHVVLPEGTQYMIWAFDAESGVTHRCGYGCDRCMLLRTHDVAQRELIDGEACENVPSFKDAILEAVDAMESSGAAQEFRDSVDKALGRVGKPPQKH